MTPVSANNVARWFVGLALLLGSPFVGIAQTRGITFATDAGEVQLSVLPVVDAIVEGDEFVTLELVDDPPNYVLAPQRAARMGLGDLTPPPDLLGFAPATGLPGTLVTLRGHSLDQTTVVTFNGVPAVFTVDSPYQVTVTVPPKAISGPIGLATPLGAITSTGTFTVLEDGKWSDGWVDRNWSDRQRSDYGFDLNSVTHADGLYVAVGEFGIIRTSPDGQKWTMQESGYLGDLYGVAAGKINGVNWFVAVGGGATREAGGVILKSMDGLNWELFKVDRPLFCVTFGNNSFLAGGLFRLFQSSDLTTWAKRETPRQDVWRETAVALAYGNGLFAMTTALAHNDGRGYRLVFTSTDGVKWERKMDRAGEWWYRYGAICFGPSAGFLTVGHHSNDFGPGSTGTFCEPNDDCYYASHFWQQDPGLSHPGGRWAHFSPDGISWLERSKPDEVGLFGLVYGDDTFVAVGNGGAIRLTLDGQFWQSFQAPTVERLRSVVYGGGQFLAVGRKGVVVTSKSGVEWAIARPSVLPFNYWSRSTLTGVASGPMGLIAVGANQTVLKAAGGGQWAQPLRAGGSEFISGSFTYSEAKTDSVQRGGRVARVFPAADGTSGLAAGWLAGTDQGTDGTWRWDGTTNIISNIPWALQQPDGAAVENNLWWNGKAAEDRKATDKGGYFIEYPDNQLAGDFRSVASGAGRYVIVGSKTVLSSSDLKIWRRSTPEATNDFTKVRFLNGQFMALGAGGALWMSSDGITWASRTSGVSTALLDGAYGAGRYIAVGESGVIVGSVDGVAWEKVQTGFTAPLRAIAFGNGTFVAVGDGGVVLASETGTGWRLRSSSGKTFLLLEFAENRFIAGDGSALFQSADGRTWEPWSRHRDFTSIYDRKRTFNALWVGERSAWLVGEYATILQSSEYLPSLPAVSLQLGEGTASEVGPRAGTFILRRSGDLSKPLTIRVRIGGTAVEPDDYVITGPILR
jgi:hypothetical protein